MDTNNIEGIIVTPLKVIEHPKGNILHALKKNEKEFDGFGEAYFSSINKNEVKGWKKHSKMTLNLIVPHGKVKFVVLDKRDNSKTINSFFEIIVSQGNYCRLTLKPGLWLAFQGLDEHNLMLNIASIEHNPEESENKELDFFNYNWNLK